VSRRSLEFAGREVTITHPDRVVFPRDGITKAQLVDYYVRVAEVMVPHVRDRPLTQQRFPSGIGGFVFWHKQIPDYFPDWVERVEVETSKGPQTQVLANDPATLAYLANQNCITPHVWLSRADRLSHPDVVIWDLDPASDRDFASVRRGARMLRDILTELGLVPFLKTTGSKGLHVVVPLDRRATFERAWSFAHEVAELLVARDPRRFTLEFYKAKRRGRVFVDVNRNAYGQTAVPPYAVRPRPGAPVATPIDWEELARVTPVKYTVRNLFRRLARRPDPWADLARHARSLEEPHRRLQGART
jgi:bifunctional non-homologous end joining protein LigD